MKRLGSLALALALAFLPLAARAGGHFLSSMTSTPDNASDWMPRPNHRPRPGIGRAAELPGLSGWRRWRWRRTTSWGCLFTGLLLSGTALEVAGQTTTNSPATNAVALPTVVVTGDAVPVGGELLMPRSVAFKPLLQKLKGKL